MHEKILQPTKVFVLGLYQNGKANGINEKVFSLVSETDLSFPNWRDISFPPVYPSSPSPTV